MAHWWQIKRMWTHRENRHLFSIPLSRKVKGKQMHYSWKHNLLLIKWLFKYQRLNQAHASVSITLLTLLPKEKARNSPTVNGIEKMWSMELLHQELLCLFHLPWKLHSSLRWKLIIALITKWMPEKTWPLLYQVYVRYLCRKVWSFCHEERCDPGQNLEGGNVCSSPLRVCFLYLPHIPPLIPLPSL